MRERSVLASSASWDSLSRASGRLCAAGHSSSTGFFTWGEEAVFCRRSWWQSSLLFGKVRPPLASASSRGLLPRLLVLVLSTELTRVEQVDEPDAGGVSMLGAGWRIAGGGWRVEGGGWRVEGGGWRVED